MSSGAARRVWLSWDRPCLPQAARWLIDHFAAGAAGDAHSPRQREEPSHQPRIRHATAPARSRAAASASKRGATLWDPTDEQFTEASDQQPSRLAGNVDAPRDGECDLQRVLCVLPGRRAGRLLLGELLRAWESRTPAAADARAAGERHPGLLIPPRVVTPGAMVDELLALDEPVASALESQLAWMSALRSCSDAELAPLLPAPPARGDDADPAPWLELAKKAASLHDELAAEGRTFADVADAAERREMLGEGDRWRVLAEVQRRQRRILGELGVTDINDARARRLGHAADTHPPIDCTHVVLIGVADLSALQRLALQRAAAEIIAMVHAPEDLAETFDDLGAVRIEAWTAAERTLSLRDDQIQLAERPVDQAQRAMREIAAIASGDPSCSASRIALGVADAALAGDLEVAAQWAGLSLHSAAGEPLLRSAPARLLSAAADFLEDQRFERLATLLRHPDLERAIVRSASAERAREEWLAVTDKYFAEHLHSAVDGAWLGDADLQDRLKALWQGVQRILEPLAQGRGEAREVRPLHEWCQGVLDVLANVYAVDEAAAPRDGRRLPPPDRRSTDACLQLREVAAEIAVAAPALQPAVDAVAALRLVLDAAKAATLSEDLELDQVETLGWLELHLDPAPNLIVVGFNDGRVPESVTADAFLPDSLRAQLGVMHNQRRLARDAYLLQATAASRAHLTLIAGRRDALNEPLLPSRLMMMCDDEALVRRVDAFARDLSDRPSPPVVGLGSAAGGRSRFVVPRLVQPTPPIGPPAAMSVTEFRRYLECPYRWALDRLLRLRAFEDGGAELDPLGFGTLTHDALSALGEEPKLAESADAEKIFRFLAQRLRRLVGERFGARPLPAIRVQCARIEQRLRAFAEFQARCAADGWRIRHCEIDISETVALDIPGDAPMPLRGKIDRIDANICTGRWRVIDYKTGERGDSPIRVHHHCRDLPALDDELAWFDLQLPLYHLLARGEGSLGVPADAIELGYIVLPRRADSACWLGADWTPKHIEHGLERARAIVRDIRRCVADLAFERNRDIDSPFDAFARICQTSAFRPSGDDEAGEGEIAFDAGGEE